MAEKLQWTPNNATADGRFAIQTERVRGAPLVHYLMVRRWVDERALRRLDIEAAFYGSRGVAKVKAAAQAIADARPVERVEGDTVHLTDEVDGPSRCGVPADQLSTGQPASAWFDLCERCTAGVAG